LFSCDCRFAAALVDILFWGKCAGRIVIWKQIGKESHFTPAFYDNDDDIFISGDCPPLFIADLSRSRIVQRLWRVS